MAKKVIVTVGELHGEDVDNYMNITAKGGTCVLTAIGSLLDTEVTLNLAMLTLMQKNLQGTIFGGGNPHYDIPQLLSMYKAGKLNLDDMITRQYKLEQINDGYQDMLDGKQHPRRHPLHRRRPVEPISMSQETVEQSPALDRLAGLVALRASAGREGWLALMADDVVIEDPIGESVHQPRRHRRAAARRPSAFYDANIGARPAHDHLRGDFPSSSPDEIAHILRAALHVSQRLRQARCAGIFTYRVNDAAAHQPARLLEHGHDEVRSRRATD